MKKNFRKAIAGVCILAMLLTMAAGLSGCSGKSKENIIILFTNDVHGGFDDKIGYAGLAAYKKELQKKNEYVTLVDCGDHVQGSFDTVVSNGEAAITLMNEVGYDYAILGNHEFDYGMGQLRRLLDLAKAQYLCANISYTGDGVSAIEKTQPYAIKKYGNTSVGFIGVTTPLSIRDTSPVKFMGNGVMVYDFKGKDDGKELIETVQKNVDECRAKGAQYVIVLAHLGANEASSPYSSLDLIAGISGVDVVLDAHAHQEIPCAIVQDKEGKGVYLGSTGTKLQNIGQLSISQDGMISLGYISSYEKKDEDVAAKITELRAQTEELKNTVMFTANDPLPITDASGVRICRNRETGIGNLITDAFRQTTGADAAIINGGGIRAGIEAGEVNVGQIIAVQPFGNLVAEVEVTGRQIMDILEYGARYTAAEYKDGKDAVGEYGSFFSVSGLRFTIDTGMPSNVVVDDKDCLIEVSGERRVQNVEILKDGEYVPIDPEANYTLGGINYTLIDGGSGMANYLADVKVLNAGSILDYQALLDYIKSLDGNLSQYSKPEGRILTKEFRG